MTANQAAEIQAVAKLLRELAIEATRDDRPAKSRLLAHLAGILERVECKACKCCR